MCAFDMVGALDEPRDSQDANDYDFSLIDMLIQHHENLTTPGNIDYGSAIDDVITTISICHLVWSIPAYELPQLKRHLLSHLISLVHGCNHIERAGASLAITEQLACHMFLGLPTPALTYAVREDLKAHLASVPAQLIAHNLSPDQGNSDEVVGQTYYEIISHARATRQLLVTLSLDPTCRLTEEHILASHQELNNGVNASDCTADFEYGGKYRDCRIFAGFTEFVAPELVAVKVKKMVKDINNDIPGTMDKDDVLDLAAKLSHTLVNIHSFVDGNGRTTRLMNAILIKYGLLGVVLGRTEEKREEYLGVAVRGSGKQEAWNEMDDEEREYAEAPRTELGELPEMAVGDAMQRTGGKLQVESL
ncbi:Hypothetical protein D9617_7g029320 [Elsinoe fawcettii]|nr:Hypothetical protein D9617_7g029320 [Elsinoe fawcettii]